MVPLTCLLNFEWIEARLDKNETILSRGTFMNRTLLVLLLGVVLVTFDAAAENLLVRSNSDSGPQSLREALMRVKDGDTIYFALPEDGEIISLESELPVTGKSFVIDGRNLNCDGRDHITLQVQHPAKSQFRVFSLLPGINRTVTLMHLILRGGDVSKISRSCDGGVINLRGEGSLKLVNCVIQDGKARRGGGIFVGGRYRDGSVIIENSRITRNESRSKSKASAGTVLYEQFGTEIGPFSQTYGNVSATHSGGIYLSNTFGTIVDCQIFDNTATDDLSNNGSFTGPSVIFRNTSDGWEMRPMVEAVTPVASPNERFALGAFR